MRSLSNLRLRTLVSLAVLLPLAAPAGAVEQGNLTELRERALALVNRAREERGLSRLELGRDLNAIAQSHAEDMLERNYYAHVSPEGESVSDRYQEAGGSRWRIVAENIARCQGCEAPPTVERVEALHEGWMNSPEHRENILARGIDRFGFGIAAGEDKNLYAVQTFAGPGFPRGVQVGEEPRPVPPQDRAEVALEAINQARRRAGVPALERNPALGKAAAALLPPAGEEDLNVSDDILGALPRETRGDWRSVSVIAGACGGCGIEPTAADIRFFIDQWLENPQYRRTLLDPDFTHLGLAMGATGEGRKVALATLGVRQ